MTISANWSYPTQVRFGADRISELADACAAAGIRKPLLVTDRGLADTELIANIGKLTSDAGLGAALFSDADPNPSETNLSAGVEAFKFGEHDGVVAIGGGSSLDIGKTIAFMAGQSRAVWDFEDIGDYWTRADADRIAPVVAVPTTAGTGSEVGRAGVITNSQTHEKKIIFHPRMLPAQVIADPALTAGMPKAITAGTGMDAFAHCLEAYSSPHYHPMSQGIALEGLRLIKEHLPRVINDPENLDSRGHMMSAAMMGAVAFQKGLGAIHALSHPIGAHFGTHHGTTNAVFMVAVLDFNREFIEERISRAARYLGIEGGFDGFCDFVTRLNQLIGIPPSLAELGITNPDLEMLSQSALSDPSVGGNPRPLTAQDLHALYEACL